MPKAEDLLARIPKIDHLAARPEVRALSDEHGYSVVREALRAATAALRAQARNDGRELAGQDLAAVISRAAAARVREAALPSLRATINATGVVLHTGLGRAVLADAAARAVQEVATAHSLLEIEPESGERGSRLAHVAALLCELSGAEDALIVNNNAAAVLLAIASAAAGREVVISRGQLVEIGGSFRIPDVIRQAGARLVEVGTTNKVRLADYEAAIGPETALILRVHPSNFRIVGFTEAPSLADLVALGKGYGLPVMDDLGSGALVDLSSHGLVAEPTVQESVQAGAGIITFSGDKLLGGPQSGLIAGEAALLAPMKRHPLLRALRVDKLTLAGMAATLRLYRDPPRALREIPTLRALTVTPAELRKRAQRLRRLAAAPGLALRLEPGLSQVGGGALPGEELPTTLVSAAAEGRSAAALARALRRGEPPVFCRVARERVLIDLRTVCDDEVKVLAGALRRAATAPDGPGESGRWCD